MNEYRGTTSSFNIMTRGAGWFRCSGILLNAGPLIEDRDVHEGANRF